jgi:hypothetical protein
MVFKDYDYKIFYFFEQEWLESTDLTFNDFIKEKDLGISLIDVDHEHNSKYDIYEVTDEKKWTITRLKYAF